MFSPTKFMKILFLERLSAFHENSRKRPDQNWCQTDDLNNSIDWEFWDCKEQKISNHSDVEIHSRYISLYDPWWLCLSSCWSLEVTTDSSFALESVFFFFFKEKRSNLLLNWVYCVSDVNKLVKFWNKSFCHCKSFFLFWIVIIADESNNSIACWDTRTTEKQKTLTSGKLSFSFPRKV